MRRQTTGTNDGPDIINFYFGHIERVVGKGKKPRRDRVNPCISALGAEQNRDEQGKWIDVIQRCRRFGI